VPAALEMNGGMNSRGKPVAKPPHSLRGRKKHVGDHYGGKGNLGGVLWGSPVNELSFGDGKGDPQVITLPLEDAEILLKSAEVQTYTVRAYRDGEVVDV